MAAVAALCCSGHALAAQPGSNGGDAEKRTYALQYLKATHADDKAQDATKRIVPTVVASVKQTHPGLSSAALEKFRQAFTARMKQNEAKLRDVQVQVLTTNFSARELKEAAAYYASPTGQHFQSVSLELMGEIAGQRQGMFNDAIRGAMKDANIPLPKTPQPGLSAPLGRPSH
jgi:hypothetical protein